jgi:arylsulfatase A-like enzyme
MSTETPSQIRGGRLAALLLVLALLAVGGGLALRRAGRTAGGVAGIGGRGNVILIVCDTLRADHLGLYGYPRPTSPFLDALGRRAWVYENAYSHFSYTWPSISNLFTGLPYSHLLAKGLFRKPEEGNEGKPGGGLSPAAVTLAERLGRAGVASAAVVANPYVTAKLGFAQGFGSYHDVYAWNPHFWEGAIHKYRVEEVNAAALTEAGRLRAQGGPWFLYLHYFDPHMPYGAPAADRALFADPSYARQGRFVDGYLRNPQGMPFNYVTDDLRDWIEPADRDQLVAQYDAEVHHFDRGMAALFAALEAAGVLEDTTVVLTADHGEAFLERRFWGHGYLSRAEEEHVPMIVVPPKSPGFRPARLPGPVTTTDLHYSVLHHFGAAPWALGSTPWWRADLFSGRRQGTAAATEGAWGTYVLRGPRYSYYRYAELAAAELPLAIPDGEYLFDRARDPGETANLFASDRPRSAALRDGLLRELGADASLLAGRWREPFLDAGEESRRRLRALGYF